MRACSLILNIFKKKKWVHICLIFNSKQMVRVENMSKITL